MEGKASKELDGIFPEKQLDGLFDDKLLLHGPSLGDHREFPVAGIGVVRQVGPLFRGFVAAGSIFVVIIAAVGSGTIGFGRV